MRHLLPCVGLELLLIPSKVSIESFSSTCIIKTYPYSEYAYHGGKPMPALVIEL